MSVNFKNIFVGARFKPVSTLTSDSSGQVQTYSVDSKTYLHNGVTRSPLVTESHTASFTNKTFDANGTGNVLSNVETADLASGVLNTSTSLTGASDTQIPSALAVKTYVDTSIAGHDQASEISYSNTTSGLTATNVQDAIDEIVVITDGLQTDISGVASDLAAHIADTVDAHDASAISVVPFTGITSTNVQSALVELEGQITSGMAGTVAGPASATDNGVARFDGTTGKLIQNSIVTISDVGVVANASIDTATNTISNIANSNIASAAAIDATKIANGTVSNAEFQYLDGVTSAIQTQLNAKVGTTDVATLTNKTINAPDNTITNIADTNIASAAAIARSKLASGNNYRILANNATGVMSENAALTSTQVTFADTNGQLTGASDLTVGTNSLVLGNTKHLELQAANDSTTTGSNASLASFTGGAIRLTNSSLVSLANIPAGSNGQDLTIFNRTGVDVQVLDSSAATGTAANRILTGTNAAITFTNNAALSLKYDSTTARWQIVGGTGSGTGSTSLDTIFQLTASEQLTDWSTGNNASFLGGGSLAGTFAKNTSTPLHGTASYSYTQAAGSLNDYLATATQAVDPRFRGTQVYLSFPFQYNGNTSDIQIIVYDVTNTGILSTTSDVVQGTNGANQVAIVGVLIPTNCTSIRVGFQVKVLNSAKVFAFDDIQVSSTIYGSSQLNNTTDPVIYTPTFGGGTAWVSEGVYYWREGKFLVAHGTALNNTPDGSSISVSLPSGLTIDSASISSTNASTIAGTWNITSGTVANAFPSSARGSFPMFISLANSTSIVYMSNNTNGSRFGFVIGSTAMAATDRMSFQFKVPILGWTAGSQAIVTPVQQISSDTIPFTFKSTAIVDADPIGTFNTYTYAANSGTAVIATTAPTQTTSSMNTDGFRLYGRAYNAASTAALPTRVDVVIGKGLKTYEIQAYASSAKAAYFSTQYFVYGATEYGITHQYSSTTGVLSLNAGLSGSSANTSRLAGIDPSTNSGVSNGYFVFNASTTPSIAALPVLAPRIATLSDVKTVGTVGGTATGATYNTRTLNTLVDPAGIVTSLSSNQFTLPAGSYYIEGFAPAGAVNGHKTRIRNITDSTTPIIGSNVYSGSGNPGFMSVLSNFSGPVVITTPKVFQLQHYIQSSVGTEDLGQGLNAGDNNIFAFVKITKIN